MRTLPLAYFEFQAEFPKQRAVPLFGPSAFLAFLALLPVLLLLLLFGSLRGSLGTVTACPPRQCCNQLSHAAAQLCRRDSQ